MVHTGLKCAGSDTNTSQPPASVWPILKSNLLAYSRGGVAGGRPPDRARERQRALQALLSSAERRMLVQADAAPRAAPWQRPAAKSQVMRCCKNALEALPYPTLTGIYARRGGQTPMLGTLDGVAVACASSSAPRSLASTEPLPPARAPWPAPTGPPTLGSRGPRPGPRTAAPARAPAARPAVSWRLRAAAARRSTARRRA